MKRTGTVWKVIVGILAAVIVLLLVAEMALRMFLSGQIVSSYEQEAGGKPEVSFGSQPITLGLLGGSLPHMTIRTPSTLVVNGDEVSGEPAAQVEMSKVRIVGGEPVAETFQVTTELPNDFVRAMLNGAIKEQIGDNRLLNNLITVSEVTTNPEGGTFSVLFTGGAAAVELRPVAAEGGVSMETVGTQLFGFDLPSDVADAMNGTLEEGLGAATAGNMRLTGMEVVPGGLRMQLSGENVNFAQMQQELVYQP